MKKLTTELESVSPMEINPDKGNLLRHVLVGINEDDMILVPSSSSHKHFLTNLGDLPERLTQTTTGNVMVLHYPHP